MASTIVMSSWLDAFGGQIHDIAGYIGVGACGRKTLNGAILKRLK